MSKYHEKGGDDVVMCDVGKDLEGDTIMDDFTFSSNERSNGQKDNGKAKTKPANCKRKRKSNRNPPPKRRRMRGEFKQDDTASQAVISLEQQLSTLKVDKGKKDREIVALKAKLSKKDRKHSKEMEKTIVRMEKKHSKEMKKTIAQMEKKHSKEMDKKDKENRKFGDKIINKIINSNYTTYDVETDEE